MRCCCYFLMSYCTRLLLAMYLIIVLFFSCISGYKQIKLVVVIIYFLESFKGLCSKVCALWILAVSLVMRSY